MDEKIVGLSITQWLPCPLAIWNLLNLIKSCPRFCQCHGNIVVCNILAYFIIAMFITSLT